MNRIQGLPYSFTVPIVNTRIAAVEGVSTVL